MKGVRKVITNFYNTNYLEHHGIKGQKWGVRNGPPYPIEDKVLPKGTRLNSVSSRYTDSEVYRKNGKPMYTYRNDERWDNKVYKGPFSKYLILYRGAKFIKEHAYETTEDLRMPTRKERFDAFKDMFNDKKTRKIVKSDLDTYQKMLVRQQVGNQKDREQYAKFNSNKIKTDEDMKVAYDIFNHAMERAYANKSTVLYLEKMKKNYDAMVDDNNQGVYNRAHDPIIVFRGDRYLKSLPEDSKYLTMKEIYTNTEEVSIGLAMGGERVKL